jgi:CHAT domain-containing protein
MPASLSIPGGWRRCLLVVLAGAQISATLLLADDTDLEKTLAEAERLAWLKNWTRAEPLFAEAERLFAARGDRRNELYCRISKLRGQLPHLANMDVSRVLGDLLIDPIVKSDQRLRLRCLVVKGDTDLDMDAALAERDWSEALALSKALGDKGWESRATGELGIITFLEGDTAGALIKLGTALKTAQATNDAGAELRYLTLVGNGMTEFGRPDQGLVYFDRALSVAQREKDLHEPMLTYLGKATALVALGRSAEAKQLLDYALQHARQTNSIGYQAEFLVQQGLLANKVGQPTEAARRFEEAARVGETVEAWRAVSSARFELSKLYEANGNLAVAEDAAKQCVAACRRVGDRFFLPRYLAREAAIQLKRGRIRDAQATYEDAEDVINGNLVNVNSVWNKSSLIAAMNDVFLGHFRAEAQFGRSPRNAFRIVEEARGRPITDMLRVRPANHVAPPAELTVGERAIAGLQIELQRTTGRRERQRILDRLYETEQSLAPANTSADRWMRIATRPVLMEDLQQRLQPDEAVLEYVLDDPNSYCLVVSRVSARIQKLAGKAELDRTVQLLVKSIRSGESTEAPGKRLYELLLLPVDHDVAGKQRLTVIPDGSLHQIPLELLIDTSSKLVLQTRTVSYAPSASVLTLLRARAPAQVARLPLLAVSASPALASPPPDVSSLASNAAGAPFSSVVRGVYDIDKTELPALPAANGEVRDVAEILGSQSVVLINATEAQVKAEPLQEFAVLHFAVHGLTSTKFPERSTLILRSDEAHHEDGLLQAREILTMRLNADLVTLAACDGVSGQVAGQEGVASLARPFLVAGARSVVANLWSANDDFSRSLMKRFYTRLAAGQDTASALRQAKLEMIELFGNRATPNLWGGFIVMGDGTGSLRHIR